jgi:parallel beta-helix repeat protein
MSDKRAFVFLSTLLLVVVTVACEVQVVSASNGVVTIHADGSVDPSSALITSVDNVTYTFTGNISGRVVVERDNIVVDGAGYTVQGTGGGIGISLSSRNNVTLSNVDVTDFENGIMLQSSSNSTITGNTAASNTLNGIYLYASSNNTITGNTAASNTLNGIYLLACSNNTITGNTAASNAAGIDLYASSSNMVSNNTVDSNTGQGIQQRLYR